MEGGKDGPPHDGWARLQALLRYMTARHDPSAEVPPAPEELQEWASDTLVATAAGMAIGGLRQWRDERLEGPLRPPADAPSRAHVARALAEQQTQRLARIADGTLRGGLRIGALASVFYAAQALSGIYRGRRDFYDTALGGLCAGALFGALGPAPTAALRLRSAVLGGALGGSVGIPVGMLTEKLRAMLPEGERAARHSRHQQTEDIIAGRVSRAAPQASRQGGAAEVIRQLEGSLAAGRAATRAPQGSAGKA